MSEENKQRVYCVVSFGGKTTSVTSERRVVHEEKGVRYVLVDGLRYRLSRFNEYEMAYGDKSSHKYSE